MSETIIFQVPEDRLQKIEANQGKIIDALQNFKAIPPDEFLTAGEFMARCKISRWTFNQLRSENKIKVIERARKLYVPETEVKRYFTEEI
jgi:hypothetical protein